MQSVYKQPAPGINWDEWSRVVEAAQDPRHRDAVQKFLAQAELSPEIPAGLDENVLAPRRSAGATGEQCAYVFCNLGFAALVAGSKGSADFAMACGRLAEQVGPDTPDLALRRLFLSAKGELVVAVLTDQPHLLWNDVAERCTAYLRALDHHLESLPTESLESNAMAAYSLTGQYLSRIHKIRAVEYYADEIGQLVEVALGCSSRLPSAFASRMWRNLMPGTDAGVLFRQIGAAAERYLQIDEDSVDHATTGLTYIEEIFSQCADQSAPDLERILRIKAELLLSSGQHTEACEQAELLAGSSDPSVRTVAIVIKARCKLNTGNPEPAAESLAQVAPTIGHALEEWRATWMGDTGDRYWTDPPDAFSMPVDSREIWRLQAVAAADSQDMPSYLAAASRSTGYLADSLIDDRPQWVERMRKTTGVRVPAPDQQIEMPPIAVVEPMVELHDIFEQLADGAAVLHVTLTEEGILTSVARKRGNDVSLTVAPDRPRVKRLTQAHKRWSRAYFDSLRHSGGSAAVEAEGAALFLGLMDEVWRIWGALLQELVDDGINQLILVGDDLVDIPLHATPIGSGNERLIDRVPVTYVPSIATLRACMSRTPIPESRRRGVALRSLTDAELVPADSEGDPIVAMLDTKPYYLAPDAASFWTDVAAAEVLHIFAHATHNSRVPFDTLIGAGCLDLSVAGLMAGLDLPQCEFVSNIVCESALPSTLRAPGFDLSAIFLAAGARNVLASTWVVKDDLASKLAQLFVEHWASGHASSEAFQRALRRLRAEQP
ncbi:MAG: CHAT domain-containing protein, partial [Woeseia sp.]